MKENTHKEPKQKPSGRVPKEHVVNRLPKTLAREAWLKSKEKAISATRTRSGSDYASAQEMEEYAVQQAEEPSGRWSSLCIEENRYRCQRSFHSQKMSRMNRRRMIPCMGMPRNRARRKPQPEKPPAPIRKQTPRRRRNDELLRSKAAMSECASNGSRNLPEGGTRCR